MPGVVLTNPGMAASVGGSGGFPPQVPGTTNAPLGWVLVKDKGALGNGIADDTAAALVALNELIAKGGGTLVWSNGTYILDWTTFANVNVPITFLGMGVSATTLKFKAAGTVALFNGLASVPSASLTFRNLTIDGNRTNQAAGVKDLIQYANAPLIFENVDFKSFTARAIYGTSIPFFRLRRFNVTDVAETTDAALAGGAGLAYLPSMTGPVDIGDGTFIQGVPTTAINAPYGIEIQGTGAQTLSGTIEDLYFERYGHKSSGANPIGCVDVYNYGNDLVIKGITGRNICHTLVKTANGPRINVEANVIGQDNNFAAPAVQIGAGVHAVTGDFPDPEVKVKASAFTAGAVCHVVGTLGSEIKNPRVTVAARNCLQPVLVDYIDGAIIDVIAEGSTGTTNPTAPISFGTGCKGKAVIKANIKSSAVSAIYANASAALDIHVLPGSTFDTTAGGPHIYCSGVRDVTLDGVQFLGLPVNAVQVLASASLRAYRCQAPAGTTISRTGTTTVIEEGNSWLQGAVAWDPPLLAAGAVQTGPAVPLLDALVGDFVKLTFSLALAGTDMWGVVEAAGAVTPYHRNPTGAGVNLAAGTVTARVSRG